MFRFLVVELDNPYYYAYLKASGVALPDALKQVFTTSRNYAQSVSPDGYSVYVCLVKMS